MTIERRYGVADGLAVKAPVRVATTANITAKSLTASFTTNTKQYDGTVAATVVGSSSQIAGSDVVTVANTSASFSDKNVGTGKSVSVSGISISGTDAGNYSVAGGGATTAEITPRMAIELGAGFARTASNPAAWAPVSLVPNPDGSTTPYPHFIDRCKPGFIAIDPRGRRFANEADSYHDFVPAMISACANDPEIYSYLICDHRTLRRYGMGVVPPFPMPIGKYLRSGYLIRGASIQELADRLSIDPVVLDATVRRYNSYAERGQDPDFGKGSNVYNHFGGDPKCQPNPNLAPIVDGPFYAVRLSPSDLGTFQGLATDSSARVLRAEDQQPISGLYAVGNDMASVMGGAYPGAGITIGPAMTFGYIAARDLART